MAVAGATVSVEVEGFVEAIPELRASFDEHIRDNDGLLPHVFFGEVAAFAFDIAKARDEGMARRLSVALERMAASSDDATVNVIHVTFIEYFVWGDEHEQAAFEWLSTFFGASMLARIDEFRDYSDKTVQVRDADG